MPDSIRLRRRLVLLACVPWLACSEPPAPTTSEVETKRPELERPEPLERRTFAITDEGSERTPTAELSEQEKRLLPIAGDPPWIDGYNPEEDPCISGNWCGDASAAAKLSANAGHVPEELGCVTRIAATEPSPIEANPKAFEGLSNHRAMQGALNQHGTELARAKKGASETTCCYHWFEYCSGRPLRDDDGHPCVADVHAGEAWTRAPERVTEGLSQADHELVPAARERLAAEWLDDALAEHASIASFARTTLELMAMGAPPELLLAVQRAAADEIDHARRCCELVRRYAGRAVDPGPLAVVPVRPASWSRLAVDTFLEGCVGETVAALAAERALGRSRDPMVRETLTVVARDEANHAALAWRTLAWALERGGDETRQALAHAAEQARPVAIPSTSTAPSEHDDTLRAHGRLTAADRTQALHDAWHDIVGPMLTDLLRASS